MESILRLPGANVLTTENDNLFLLSDQMNKPMIASYS
ncbi:uncharacterized protein METZ01_LOCUS91623 [marine metagenome]|uniref:Uncharacterized protein n=1 Tax=marine metagenome TaxID=408172 RepID=A0A381VEH6_9ZZZZ